MVRGANWARRLGGGSWSLNPRSLWLLTHLWARTGKAFPSVPNKPEEWQRDNYSSGSFRYRKQSLLESYIFQTMDSGLGVHSSTTYSKAVSGLQQVGPQTATAILLFLNNLEFMLLFVLHMQAEAWDKRPVSICNSCAV